MDKKILKEIVRRELASLLVEQEKGEIPDVKKVLMAIEKAPQIERTLEKIDNKKDFYELLKKFLGMSSKNVPENDAKQVIMMLARQAQKS
tara:strand:+ start:467 stop:736 length:270 start_codon:yes stop_codon:yes gene_type:complete